MYAPEYSYHEPDNQSVLGKGDKGKGKTTTTTRKKKKHVADDEDKKKSLEDELLVITLLYYFLYVINIARYLYFYF